MTQRILTMEEIDWAYGVTGGGMTIRTLCELKDERDALLECRASLSDYFANDREGWKRGYNKWRRQALSVLGLS